MKNHGLTSLSVILFLTLNLSACNLLGSEEKAADEVVVKQVGETVIVTNETSLPIYTDIHERTSLALLDAPICSNPDLRGGIAPGESQTLRLQKVDDYETGDEVVVWWWHLRSKDGTDEYEIVDFTAVVIDT